VLRSAIIICVALLASFGCSAAPPSLRPVVILISIDGFRWDYFDRFKPPALSALAAAGVRSEGLIPQFPSKTYPNHYSIVTGLRPAHHGILSNTMLDAAIPARFTLSDRAVLADPRWWGGEPIWNTAERQGLKASALFWPGSETAIGGRHASFWLPYDGRMPNSAQVAKTLEWLALPEGQRPSFLTLYFSEVDSTGHSRGPDSMEVQDAVAQVDVAIAQLVTGVRHAGLEGRAHYVIVSDHGMAPLSADRMIVLDTLIPLDAVDVIDWSPVLGVAPRTNRLGVAPRTNRLGVAPRTNRLGVPPRTMRLGVTPANDEVETVYRALKDRHPALTVYKSAELPARYGLAGHPRLPPIVGIAEEGWHITSARDVERWNTEGRQAPGGNHGYDPQLRSMHGLLIASGPRLRQGARVPAIENIHVYEFLCALLGIEPAPNDGAPAATRGMFKQADSSRNQR
jgi:predicted AlkP superfamily pyrophosphatase or phosphodiesterase